MPVIVIVANKPVQLKKELAASATQLVADECRVPAAHVHVLIQDNQFFSFGNDADKAAAYVTVKSAALQILPEARRNLVAELVPVLQAAVPDLDGYRINTMFEDLPVECIAVGANIATFSKPGGGSARNSLGGMPISPTGSGQQAALPHA